MPRTSAKVRKHKNKTKGDLAKKRVEVYDEWEHSDIDRDEQEAGMKRRAKRWKEIELDQKRATELEKRAIDEVEKIKRKTLSAMTKPIEQAWLRCDYILSNIMEQKAYEFMEWQRLNDPKCYKWLYRQFMSKAMMVHAQTYVDYFANGNEPPYKVKYGTVIKAYKKYKGIKSKIKIVHKGEEEWKL